MYFYFFLLIIYMRSIFFIFITYFIFWFRVGTFIFFLISMQHLITWPRCTFHSAILSLGHIIVNGERSPSINYGHMEEELSTACRAAADALEILSNLRPGFTRKVIPRINSSTAVSVSQANSGERQVNRALKSHALSVRLTQTNSILRSHAETIISHAFEIPYSFSEVPL